MSTAHLAAVSSPRMLTRLLETVARGIRTTRGLQEALGVGSHAVRTHVYAGLWLSLVESSDPVTLSARGLTYVYGGSERQAIYARAVRDNALAAELLAASGGALPELDSIAKAIARAEPSLPRALLEQRASALRALIAPAVGVALEIGPPQLALPMEPHDPPKESAALRACSEDHDPDAYRYLLARLLDYGELTVGHIRSLIDAAGGSGLSISGLVEIALARGDAVRIGDHLVATEGAVVRRDAVRSTSALLLSDPGYRTYLIEAASGRRSAAPRRDGELARYRRWDRRLVGQGVPAGEILAAIQRQLLDENLAAVPLAGPEGTIPLPESRAFLDAWDRVGLRISLPPSLLALRGGLAAVNRSLRGPRGPVAPPDLCDRPLVVHAGIVHPGEPQPRSVPDVRTLRLRLLMHAPYPAIVAALLWLHRVEPGRVSVIFDAQGWIVRRTGGDDILLLDFVDAFAVARGWIPVRRREGVGGTSFVEVMERFGIATTITRMLILCEALFTALSSEAEEMEVCARLVELADAIDAFLFEGPLAGGRER